MKTTRDTTFLRYNSLREAFKVHTMELRGKFQDGETVRYILRGYNVNRKDHYRSTLINIVMMDIIAVTGKFPILPWIALFIAINSISTFLFEYRV